MIRLRRKVYEWLEPGEQSNPWEHVFDGFLILLILVSVVVVVLQSLPEMAVHDKLFNQIEEWCVYFFTVEYILRLWTCVESPEFRHPVRGRLQYSISAMSLIDLMALLPFYLSPLAANNAVVFRLLRIFRLIRLLKFGRYNASIAMLVRVFRSRRAELFLSLGLVLTLVVIASTLMYAVEHDAQPKVFSSIPAATWWGIVTMTTVGYGDVYPVTTAGRVVAGFSVLLGVGLFALPAGILASGFQEEMHTLRGEAGILRRVCFRMRVRDGRMEEFRERYRECWPEIRDTLHRAGWRNHSLFLSPDGEVVSYAETADPAAARRSLDSSRVYTLWQREMEDLLEPAEPVAAFDEIFHLD